MFFTSCPILTGPTVTAPPISCLICSVALKTSILLRHLKKSFVSNEAVVQIMHSPEAYYAQKRSWLFLTRAVRHSCNLVDHIRWDVTMLILPCYMNSKVGPYKPEVPRSLLCLPASTKVYCTPFWLEITKLAIQSPDTMWAMASLTWPIHVSAYRQISWQD